MEPNTLASDEIEPARLAEIRKKISHESILLARKIIKINKKNKGQERCIVLTHTNLYNIEKTTIKRTIRMPCIEAVSISLTSNEIVLHVPSEYDYRYECGYRDELVHALLHAREVHIKLKEELMVFLLPERELDAVTTTEDDFRKERRRSPSIQPKMVRLDNVAYVLYNEIITTKDERLLYISSDRFLNFKKPEFQQLVKVGVNSVCELHVVRCSITKQKQVVREHRKGYLSVPVEVFRGKLMAYKANKFWTKVIFATERQTLFELSYQPYIGDLYGELSALSEFDEDIIKHVVIRLVLALQTLDELYPAMTPENILVDQEGNTYLSYFNMYIRCSVPYEYLTPEELLEEVEPGKSSVQLPRMANVWKLGVLAYELAYGVPPFCIQELVYLTLNDVDPVMRYPFLDNKSPEFHSFLESILRKRPSTRLGANNFFEEFRATKWLKDINWEAYRRSNVTSRKYFKALRLEDNFAESSSIEYIY